MDKDYYVYILASQRNGTLYVGVTSNLIKRETAEILSINPLYPPVLGDFISLGDTPRPPAGSILHLFFSGLKGYGNTRTKRLKVLC